MTFLSVYQKVGDRGDLEFCPGQLLKAPSLASKDGRELLSIDRRTSLVSSSCASHGGSLNCGVWPSCYVLILLTSFATPATALSSSLQMS